MYASEASRESDDLRFEIIKSPSWGSTLSLGSDNQLRRGGHIKKMKGLQRAWSLALVAGLSLVSSSSISLRTSSPPHQEKVLHDIPYGRLLALANDEALSQEQESRCDDLEDCGMCFRRPGCGWCGSSSQCTSNPDSCEKGWSDTTCYTTCPMDSTPMHEAAGVIQLGSQPPHPVYYLPNETCAFTIWPLPGGGNGGATTGRHAMMIRLQFEYVDLGGNDHIDIYSNSVNGPRLLTVTGVGSGVVNRIITSRSNTVVIKLTAGEDSEGGTGFRLYYRVIESSPLDIYLISAIIVTSILTCILCSCCCNNCVAMIAGQPGRRFSSGAHRSLSAEEKARLPIIPYESTDVRSAYKECCICLSDFESTDMVRKLPCSHVFHDACIDAWLDLNSTCPLCKKDAREKIGGNEPASGSRGGRAAAASSLGQGGGAASADGIGRPTTRRAVVRWRLVRILRRIGLVRDSSIGPAVNWRHRLSQGTRSRGRGGREGGGRGARAGATALVAQPPMATAGQHDARRAAAAAAIPAGEEEVVLFGSAAAGLSPFGMSAEGRGGGNSRMIVAQEQDLELGSGHAGRGGEVELADRRRGRRRGDVVVVEEKEENDEEVKAGDRSSE